MKFSTRLRNVLKEKGMTQTELSKRAGISKSVISEWLSDKYEPKQDKIYMVAEALSVSPSWLFGVSDNKEVSYSITTIYNQLSKPRQQKVYNFAERQLEQQNHMNEQDDYYGRAAAGAPIEGQQPPVIYGDSADVSLLVSGDSMESLYHDGDVITYRKQPTLENGEIGVFVLNGGITMKKFKWSDNGIRLQSLNNNYKDIIVTETDEFNILGKVIS